jgi:hypothetical protein
MRDRGKKRQAVDYLIDMGLVICGEEDDMTNHGRLWLDRDE